MKETSGYYIYYWSNLSSKHCQKEGNGKRLAGSAKMNLITGSKMCKKLQNDHWKIHNKKERIADQIFLKCYYQTKY